MTFEDLQFDKRGLIPAVIQDVETGQVLMMAYMNQEALEETLSTGYACFYSRSRQQLWRKGESSGHVQRVCEIRYDCDGDTLLVQVQQTGAACHTGSRSCFFRVLPFEQKERQSTDANSAAGVLAELYETIADRQANPLEGSYTTYLFEKGQDKILKKVGEEAAETIIASKNMDKGEVLYEMADLWYHCMVLLAFHRIAPMELLRELHKRRKNKS